MTYIEHMYYKLNSTCIDNTLLKYLGEQVCFSSQTQSD